MVTVPIGTLFVAGSSAQNMVTVAPSMIDLTSAESANFVAGVACANIGRAVPSASDSFSVSAAPNQAALSLALPVIAQSAASFSTIQAAVWVITDNANYADLGILVRSVGPIAFPGGGGSRMINHYEAAQAMMLIDSAGLDITTTRIWRDRKFICAEVASGTGAVSGWCQGVLTGQPPDVIGRPRPMRIDRVRDFRGEVNVSASFFRNTLRGDEPALRAPAVRVAEATGMNFTLAGYIRNWAVAGASFTINGADIVRAGGASPDTLLRTVEGVFETGPSWSYARVFGLGGVGAAFFGEKVDGQFVNEDINLLFFYGGGVELFPARSPAGLRLSLRRLNFDLKDRGTTRSWDAHGGLVVRF
jgi:hypothetical protein